MRKRLRQIALLLLALSVLLGSGAALAEGNDEQMSDQPDAVHFVLVLDCTGSMDKADAEGMSVAAAELFVDVLPMDNATVSVICFGKLWQQTYTFKNGGAEELKPFLNQSGKFSNKLREDSLYITTLCECQSLKNVTERSELKNKIEEAGELVSANTVTVANSAMLAAIDLLKSTKVEPENACIILMSDGRVQTERREAMDAVTAINPYPCYVLELNYDQKNTPTTVSRKQLVNIAAKYDGDKDSDRYIEVKSAGDVIQAVSAAIGRFIDLKSVNPIKLSVEDNQPVQYTFFVPQMASESNIVVTGEGFQKMIVTPPNGQIPVTYERTNTVDPNNTFIRNLDKYAVLKMKRPAAGEYKVTIYGETGTNIYVHAISATELNFVLRATDYEPNSRDVWLKNDVIKFSAGLEDENGVVPGEAYYPANPAQITITNENTKQKSKPIDGTPGPNGYTWEIPLQEAGAIDVSAYLTSEDLRGGGKQSNTLTYMVKNLELTLGEGQTLNLPAQMYVNELSGPIDVSKIFVNPDSDKVSYAVVCKDENGQAGNMTADSTEQGIITLQMPERGGQFTGTLSARDDNMQQPISIDFSIEVVNRPIHVSKELSLDTIMIGQPTWLGGKSNKLTYALGECYQDPDHLPLNYQLTMGKTDDPNVSIVLDGENLIVQANDKGSERATLLVTDSGGSTHEVQLNARAEHWLVVLFEQNLKYILMAIGLLILVLIALSLRRVKGGWYVSIRGAGGSEQVNMRYATLTSQKTLRKPVLSLISILLSAEEMCDSESSNMPDLNYVTRYPKLYGSLLGSRVVVKGLDKKRSNAEVFLGDKKLDSGRSRVVLKSGQHLEFRYNNGMEDVLTARIERE
jgi:hypothetical protein